MGLSRQSSMDLRWIRKQERKKTFASLRDLGIGAYLLNPLKDTYQADDIARDYLHMTLPILSGIVWQRDVSCAACADR